MAVAQYLYDNVRATISQFHVLPVTPHLFHNQVLGKVSNGTGKRTEKAALDYDGRYISQKKGHTFFAIIKTLILLLYLCLILSPTPN